MRKICVFDMVSLDGFFEGPNHDLSWHTVDEEFNEFAIEQIKSMEAILFGRITYEMMNSYWPTAEAIQEDPIVANLMNTWPKIVFSRTLHQVTWNNSLLVYGDAYNEVCKLRQMSGKDLVIFGSANLTASLMDRGLIDELRIMVSPTILGSGTPLFTNENFPVKCSLIKTRIFKNGNVLLYYEPMNRAGI